MYDTYWFHLIMIQPQILFGLITEFNKHLFNIQEKTTCLVKNLNYGSGCWCINWVYFFTTGRNIPLWGQFACQYWTRDLYHCAWIRQTGLFEVCIKFIIINLKQLRSRLPVVTSAYSEFIDLLEGLTTKHCCQIYHP